MERVSWRKSEGTARRLVSLDDFEVRKSGFTIAPSQKQLVQNALSHPRAVAFTRFLPLAIILSRHGEYSYAYTFEGTFG